MRFKKNILVFIGVLCFYTTLQAQILRPARWSYHTSEREVEIGDEIELIFKVKLDDTWHLYSNEQDYEIGPLPTEIHFEPHESYRIVGALIPKGEIIAEYDTLWEETVRYFKHEAEFRQKVKILKEEPVIRGNYTYQVCTTVDGRCVPGDEDFAFNRVIVKRKQGKKKIRNSGDSSGGGVQINSHRTSLGYGTCEKPRYGDMLHFPYGLQGYFDLQKALVCARIQSKPLLISFTAHNCLSCQEMEAQVWLDKEVLRYLKEGYVIAALYVDEKMWLPAEEWYFSNFTNQLIKTVGARNADYQVTKFNRETQPFYVLMDAQEQLLAEPRAISPEDGRSFVEFLREGNERFNQLAIGKAP